MFNSDVFVFNSQWCRLKIARDDEDQIRIWIMNASTWAHVLELTSPYGEHGVYLKDTNYDVAIIDYPQAPVVNDTLQRSAVYTLLHEGVIVYEKDWKHIADHQHVYITPGESKIYAVKLSERARQMISDEPIMASETSIDKARELYAVRSDDDVEVDPDASVSTSEEGTWVSGWLWVAKEEED